MNFFENAVVLDRYQITGKVEDGPVFSVYLGKNLDTNSQVSIKILNPGKFTRYEVDKICFNNELPQIKGFTHNSIMHLLEAGSYSNTICLVYEYVDFQNLHDFLESRGPLDLKLSLRLISQLASALSYAHGKGILHRNIKADNIAVYQDPNDNEYSVKLFDFGASYIVDYGSTTSEDVDASFGFMAPESTGLLDTKVDARSDLYSLGILLYRFVTGNYPFHADTIDNMVYQHVAVMPKNPTDFNPTIPEAVSKMIMKLLTKDPDQRYQTANELINDIDLFKCENLTGEHLQNDDLLQTMNQRSRLLSRKYELAQLRNYYSKALEGPGRFCLVTGALGFGKSDLFANLCNELARSEIPYYRAHFSAQSSMTPYHAFHDILLNFTEQFSDFDRKLQMTERSRLARTLMGLSDLVFKICPEMRRILPESLALPTLEGYREQQRSVMLLSSFFLSLHAQGKPFVIILDDIHYADPASLSLLCEMANRISEYKVFVVCSCREGRNVDNTYLASFLELFKQHDLFTEIILRPFTEVRMCEYLSDLLILDKNECQVLAAYMTEKTGGNPYFAVNVLRSMLEDGIISVNTGVLEQNWEQLRSLNQSSDVFQIITRRMDKFSEEGISLLEIASVIGDDFSVKLLQTVTDLSDSEIQSLINTAVSLQFIEYSSTSNVMEFSHRDIHTVFYSRVDDNYLQELHYWIAKAIEYLSTDLSKDIYSLVFHLNEADARSDLRRYIMQAGLYARESNANTEALNYYNQALKLMAEAGEQESDDWFTAKHAIVELNLAVGHFDLAISTANELLPKIVDNIERAKLLHQVALGYYRQSNFPQCEKLLLDALKYLQAPIPTSQRSINFHYGSLRFQRFITSKIIVDPTAAKRHKPRCKNVATAQVILSIYETLCWVYAYSSISRFNYLALHTFSYAYKNFGPSKELASALSTLSVYHLLHGNFSLSDESQMLAMKLCSSLNDTYGTARCKYVSGLCQQWRSNTEKSLKSFREASEGFSAVGDLWELNNTNIFLSHSLCMSGDYEGCEKLCGTCITDSTRLQDNFGLVMTYCNLIACFTEMGNLSNAEEVAKRCMIIVSQLNLDYATALFNYHYGRLLIEQNKYNDAVTCLSKCIELLEKDDLSPVYIASCYAYLAMARIRILDRERTNLSLNEVQTAEYDISILCDKANAISKNTPEHMIIACRANALFGILTERFKRTENAYHTGADMVPDCAYHYVNAKLAYEYGQYLLSKHRNNEARYYIFESYMTFSNINSLHYLKASEKVISEKYREDFHNSTLLTDIAARRNRLNVDRKVNTLLRLGDRLTSTLELEELQRKILQDAVELVGAERGILFLYPESGEKKLYVASVYNLGNFDRNTYDWMLEEVEKNRKPIVINDVQSDEYRKHYSVMARYGIKSVMAMPMFVRGTLFGVIYLDSRLVRQIFSDDYIDAMSFIANQGGAPIENARLYHRAITDGLTGIYGRSYLDNLIIDRTSDENVKLSAIMIDVDNFKRCNDTYGHPFGDKVLKQIASIMKRVSGDAGTPCRYGGEEFVVLLDSNDPEFATEIADKIRQNVENSTLACNNGTDVALISVTISLGVSVWDSSMERVDLIEHADKALYYAKTHGKNQVVLWNKELSE